MGPNSVCESCKEPVDTEICWCGDFIDSHRPYDGHMPVKMGCICYFDDGKSQERYERYLDELAKTTPET